MWDILETQKQMCYQNIIYVYYLGDNAVMEEVALDRGAMIGSWVEADDT